MSNNFAFAPNRWMNEVFYGTNKKDNQKKSYIVLSRNCHSINIYWIGEWQANWRFADSNNYRSKYLGDSYAQ